MNCCGPRCKQVLVFLIGLILITFGLLLIFGWETAIKTIRNNELILQPNSQGFQNWIVTPIPMYLTFYMFNWTNAPQVTSNWSIKPVLQELGPYVFSEKHYRVQLQWHDNNTITYQTKRVWHFLPEKSNGSLSDVITSLNVIPVAVANKARNSNFFVKETLNFFLHNKEKNLYLSKTVIEWLFDGYQDELLVFARQLNISMPGLNSDRFGWFYGRNNSETYDGTFTMYTGKSDLELLGIIEEWNGQSTSFAYKSYCGYVNGTSGELWPPVEKYNKVSIFSSDLCSSLALFNSRRDPYINGLLGKEFVGTDFLFDNGTKYPEQKCFVGAGQHPSGVRDVGKCKFGAPAFMSYPHFLMGDPSYLKRVEGLSPNATRHKFRAILEPTTGVPLSVNARLQLNIFISFISFMPMFSGVQDTMLPVFWFEQSATLSDEIADTVKTLIVLPAIGHFTGVGLLVVGALIFCIGVYITARKAWRGTDQTQLLPNQM